jgi:hypothetical protein
MTRCGMRCQAFRHQNGHQISQEKQAFCCRETRPGKQRTDNARLTPFLAALVGVDRAGAQLMEAGPPSNSMSDPHPLAHRKKRTRATGGALRLIACSHRLRVLIVIVISILRLHLSLSSLSSYTDQASTGYTLYTRSDESTSTAPINP